MPDVRIVNRLDVDLDRERAELIAGLTARPAAIAPKYFYDRVGCALYRAICELPEYYPTRTEQAIFLRHRDAIAEAIGRGGQFVDLGAGDCRKARSWLPLVAPSRYLAVDIAADAIAAALATMAPEFPEVEMVGIVDRLHAGPGPGTRPGHRRCRCSRHLLLPRLVDRKLRPRRCARVSSPPFIGTAGRTPTAVS